MDNLPHEIVIQIINELLPFDILVPFKPLIPINFENSEKNYKQIFESNKNIINLARTCKFYGKFCYKFGFPTIYFPLNINIKSLLIYKSKKIISPYDTTFNHKNLENLNDINILILSSNTLLDHIGFSNANITKFETGGFL